MELKIPIFELLFKKKYCVHIKGQENDAFSLYFKADWFAIWIKFFAALTKYLFLSPIFEMVSIVLLFGQVVLLWFLMYHLIISAHSNGIY